MIEELVVQNEEIKDVLREELEYLSQKIAKNVVEKYRQHAMKEGWDVGLNAQYEMERRLAAKIDKKVTLRLKISIEELDTLLSEIGGTNDA